MESGSSPTRNGAASYPGFFIYDNLADFEKAIKDEYNLSFDFNSVLTLSTDFIQSFEGYLILNLKHYNGKEANSLLFLTPYSAYAFLTQPLNIENAKPFHDFFEKSYGRSTVLAYLVLDMISISQTRRLEGYIKTLRELENNFEHEKYVKLALEMEHFSDRLEEFHGLLIKMQERSIPQIITRYITFDYNVLISENISLQTRCRHRLNTLKELRQEHEMRNTEELNQRIIKLNDVVRKLTAITVILMIPTLIASHFGMNFTYMPELRVPWVYPTVVVAQLLVMGAGLIVFRKIRWL